MKSIFFLGSFLSIFCTTDLHAAAKIGDITKACETTNRATEYNKIVTHVNTLRKDPKKFAIWYKNTYQRAYGTRETTEKKGTAGLNTLRDLGTYHPDPAKNQQKNITTAADARKKGTPLKELGIDATAEQFAEQLSLVHPSNNTVFTAVMECVHKGRNAKEDIVETVPATVPAPHVFTQNDLDEALAGVDQPNTTADDLDDILFEDFESNLGGVPAPIPVSVY